MVSLYGKRVFCSSKLIQVFISLCVSNEKQGGLSKDEINGDGNAKIQISTNNRSTHATSSLVHFLGVFCKTTTRKEKKNEILTTTLTYNSKFFIFNFFFNTFLGILIHKWLLMMHSKNEKKESYFKTLRVNLHFKRCFSLCLMELCNGTLLFCGQNYGEILFANLFSSRIYCLEM